MDDDTTYSIVRYYAPAPDGSGPSRPSRVIDTGLSLEDAQAHCQREDTHEPGEWFDGYTKER